MPDDPVQAMIFQRLQEIHENLQGLRAEFHGQVAKVAALEQWKTGHDQRSQEKDAENNRTAATVASHTAALSEMGGALRMLKIMGSVLLALVTIGELMIHFNNQRAGEVQTATAVPVIPSSGNPYRGGH